MSRYIDAKKMEEWVRKVYKDDPHIIPLLIRAIRFQMTADVQEVKTAYWEWFEDWGFDGEVTECQDAGYRCSNCKAIPHESLYFDNPDDLPPFRYCPHCGCLMKEYGK